MKIKPLTRYLSLSVLCLGLAFAQPTLATSATASMPPPQYHGSLVVVTGGIGSDEVAAFRRVRANYALSLNYSVTNNGDRAAFVSDVQVVIRDSADQTLLNMTTDGPFCFIQIWPVSTRFTVLIWGKHNPILSGYHHSPPH